MSERKYSGADWLEKQGWKNFAISPLGREVADLLGDLYRGIYHLSEKDLKDTHFENDQWIEFVLAERDLSTVDGDGLTRIVVLAHDRRLRVAIHPRSDKSFLMVFHKCGTGTGMILCPTLEDHAAAIRASLV